MIKSSRLLLTALFIPIVVIAGLAVSKSHDLKTGNKIILPITGYDPRDMLSGHYITYNVDYGIAASCGGADVGTTAYICYDSTGRSSFSYGRPADCPLVVRGSCSRGRFLAGIERFYVPEQDAAMLDALVRAKKAEIEISVARDGTALVKDLLIEGRSWKKR